MSAIGDFFLNQTTTTDDTSNKTVTKPVEAAVSAPAFSLTKVVTAASVVVTPIGALIVKLIGGKDFKFQPGQVVVLTLGLLGFIAIASSADVLARAIAAGSTASGDVAKAQAEAAKAQAETVNSQRDTVNLIPFATPLKATFTASDGQAPTKVSVLAATGGSSPFYLLKEGDKLHWMATSKVTITGAD